MRRRVGLLVGLIVLGAGGTALAGQGATNTNGDFIDLSVRVTPPKSGTAKHPRGVALSFDSFTGNRIRADDETPSTSTQVVFDNNFRENGLKFPACTINPKGLSVCAPASQIGSGTAEAQLLRLVGPPTFLPATLAAYNGNPVSGKNPTIIFIASIAGTPTAELDYTVARLGAGLAFDEIVTPGATQSPYFITKFSVNIPDRIVRVKVHGKKRKIHLIDAPTSCHGAWTFSQTNTFASQPPLTATDSEPCVKG